MKQLIGVLSFIFLTVSGYSQVVSDAARFSQTQLGGTARYIGVGGSMGALGGDFSVLSVNPAGLATYRRSEFVLTPSFSLINADASLRVSDMTTNYNRSNFNLNNLGVIFVRKPRSGSKWKTFNVGLGYNRIANYREQFNYEGVSQGSITESWLIDANNISSENPDGFISDFSNGLGIDAGALYLDSGCGDLYYQSDFIDPRICDSLLARYSILREGDVERNGSTNEMVLSFAGNYNEKFMFGLTLGVPFLSYSENTVYREQDINESVPGFNALRFNEQLSVSGIGINGKLGVIYRHSQAIRLGAAIHTPTLYSLTDNFESQLTYDFVNLDNENEVIEAESPEGVFDYGFRSPWRYIANAGFLIAKSGFISTEVEFVNYGSSNFNITKDDASFLSEEESLNNDIDNTLNSAINFRIGGEYALKRLRFRGGVNLLAPVFDDESDYNNDLSLGLGYRLDGFFVDLAYVRMSRKFSYVPYSLGANDNVDYFLRGTTGPQVVDVDVVRNNLFLTVGFKF